MAKWTIREMVDAMRRDDLYKSHTFLFQDMYDAPETEETDTRPEWAKEYADVFTQTNGLIDDLIRDKYGAFVFCTDNESAIDAYKQFYKWNIVFTITHNAELNMVYKAFRTEYNPAENYDRYEITEDEGGVTTGATSKTSPDDSEVFYNVGSADSETDTSNKRESHIHGNIGVTTTTAMIKEVVTYFSDNAFMDWLIERIMKDSCYICDYGNNAL